MSASIRLTKADKLILESYSQLVDGLSAYLGSSYEIVLHSLENYEHSAIKIANGQHTGREIGAPITDLGLIILSKIQSGEKPKSSYNYFSRNKNGNLFRSTSVAIHGENNRVIGFICINFNMDSPICEILENLTKGEHFDNDARKQPEKFSFDEDYSDTETFSETSTELIEDTVRKVREEVMEDNAVAASVKNKEIIRRLSSRGVFEFKDAVVKTSKVLNVSKNTVYLHLRNTN